MSNFNEHINGLCKKLEHIRWIAEHIEYYVGVGEGSEVVQNLKQYGSNIYTFPQEAKNTYERFAKIVSNNPYEYQTQKTGGENNVIYVNNVDGYLVSSGEYLVPAGFLRENSVNNATEAENVVKKMLDKSFSDFREEEQKTVNKMQSDIEKLKAYLLAKFPGSLFVNFARVCSLCFAALYFYSIWSIHRFHNNGMESNIKLGLSILSLILGLFFFVLCWGIVIRILGEKYKGKCINTIQKNLTIFQSEQNKLDKQQFLQNTAISQQSYMSKIKEYNIDSMMTKLGKYNKKAMFGTKAYTWSSLFQVSKIWLLILIVLGFYIFIGGDFKNYKAARAKQKAIVEHQKAKEKAEEEKRVEEMLAEEEQAAEADSEMDSKANSDILFDENGFIFADSSSRYMDLSEITALEKKAAENGYEYKDVLGFARNEIYARKGHQFNETGKYHPYYSQFEWYNNMPHVTVTEEMLTPIERHNLDLILSIEREYGWHS